MNKLSVTVGMTALNEENNIRNIVRSLLSQNHTNHVLKEIIIISDGSNDNTVKYAKSIKSKKIKTVSFTERGGMTRRLNVLFRMFNTDVFIKIDADLLPVNKNLINEMVKPFIENSEVGLVGGKLIAKKVDSYLEKIINVSRLTWDGIKKEYMDGNSFYSLPGGIYAISKKFSKFAIFPESVWSDVGYLHYSCLRNGFLFRSNKKGLVYLNLPSNLKDYIKQISRYGSQIQPLVDLFGENVKEQYYIPRDILFKHKLTALFKYPIECIYLFLINMYVKVLSVFKQINASAMWQVAETSKKKIL